MFRYTVILYTATIVLSLSNLSNATSSGESSCESSSNSTCSINDSQCFVNFFNNLRSSVAGTGLAELNIPVLEPYAVSDVKLDFLGFDVTLVTGEAIGISTCRLLEYSLNVETFQQETSITCSNITINGTYTITPKNMDDKSFWADKSVYGDGNINLVTGDWYYNFVTPFKVVRRDGLIYLDIEFYDSKYVSEIRGGAELTLDGLRSDGKDISKFAMKFFNEDWEIINSPLARDFHQKTVDYYYDTYIIFFNAMPASSFICDDLSQYVSE